MRVLQDMVFSKGINPVDSTGATTAGTAFEVVGYSHVACIISIGNIAANASAFKIETSDDNSNWSDLSGYAFTSPTAASSDNTIYGAFIETGGGAVKRYLRVTITGGAGATLVSAIWIGSDSHQTPSSAAERGLTEQLVPST